MMLLNFSRVALTILFLVSAFAFAGVDQAFAVNNPPAIGAIANQTNYVDHPALFKLYVSDPETATNDLQLSLISSNPTLFPATNVCFYYFLFDPDGPHRYITMTPAFGQTGTATNTLFVSDGTNITSAEFVVTVLLPPGAARFANTNPITIPLVGAASVYPWTNVVSGMSGTITNMTLTLSKINHEYIGDVHMLLVGPTGQRMVVFSRISVGNPAANVTVTLTDAAIFSAPDQFLVWSEQFKPTDWAISGAFSNNFPAPAPAGPYGPVSFSKSFNGLPANGTWSLYVYDDFGPDQGNIVGGWSLMISTTGDANSIPTISEITNRSIFVNTATAAIPFTIGDVETAPDLLVLTVSSTNLTLLPTNNIVFGGSGSNRTLTLTPVANQIGTTLVTVQVSDGVTNKSDSFVLTVDQGQLTVTGITAGNKVYDGTNVATLNVSGATLQGVVGSPSVTLDTGSATGAFINKNVGTGKTVQVAGLTLTGAHAGNYALTQPTTTADITARASTVSATGVNKIYDGSNTASISSYGTLTSVLAPDVVALDPSSASAAFDTGNVGTNKTVTVSGLALSGPDAANYTIGPQTTLANIAVASLTVTALNSNKVYGASLVLDGTAFARSGTVYNGDTLTSVTLASLGTPSAATVGSYAIVPSAAQGAGLTNYLIGYSNGTLTVTTRALSVVASNATRLYGQADPVFTGTISGIQNGDDITYRYSSAATTESLPGTYAVVPAPIDPAGKLTNYSVGMTNGVLTVLDVPRLISMSESPAGTFTLAWQVYADRTYRFEYKNNLLEATWTPLSTNTATSSSLTNVDNAGVNIHRIYRALDVTPANGFVADTRNNGFSGLPPGDPFTVNSFLSGDDLMLNCSYPGAQIGTASRTSAGKEAQRVVPCELFENQ